MDFEEPGTGEDAKAIGFVDVGGSHPHMITFGEPLRQEVVMWSLRDRVILSIERPPDMDLEGDEDEYMLNPAVCRWLDSVCRYEDWEFDGVSATLSFRDRKLAMMFKLTFADGVCK